MTTNETGKAKSKYIPDSGITMDHHCGANVLCGKCRREGGLDAGYQISFRKPESDRGGQRVWVWESGEN